MKQISYITAACLATLLLASCATTSEQDRFALADTNRDDQLSRKEVSDAAVRTIFTKFDSNQDGKLTFDEWHQSDKGATRRLFAERDANSDSHLTLDEARASADHQNFLQEFVKKVDLNDDGLISREEAAAFAEKEGHSAV